MRRTFHGWVSNPALVMVHASLKAIGPVDGGAASIVSALLDAVGPTGSLMGYASWDRSPYEETLNGARMDAELRHRWPPFDPAISGTYRGFGLLNRFLLQTPGARRSAHPDASMVAVGPLVGTLTRPHELGQAFGLDRRWSVSSSVPERFCCSEPRSIPLPSCTTPRPLPASRTSDA